MEIADIEAFGLKEGELLVIRIPKFWGRRHIENLRDDIKKQCNKCNVGLLLLPEHVEVQRYHKNQIALEEKLHGKSFNG